MDIGTRKRKQIHRSAEQWRDLVAAWRASGKNRRAWSLEQGVSCKRLRRWTKRLRRSVQNAPLVQLSREPSPAAVDETLRVRITREGELELSRAMSEELLRSLPRAMREAAGVR